MQALLFGDCDQIVPGFHSRSERTDVHGLDENTENQRLLVIERLRNRSDRGANPKVDSRIDSHSDT